MQPAGVASAFFVYLIVRVFLDLRFEVALIAALLVAIEPGQLFYERMVMAEAFGSAIWLGFLVLVDPMDPLAQFLLGRVYAKMGRSSEAVQIERKALAIATEQNDSELIQSISAHLQELGIRLP